MSIANVFVKCMESTKAFTLHTTLITC